MSVPRFSAPRRRVGASDELVVLAADDQRLLAGYAKEAAEKARREADRPLCDWAAEIMEAHREGALALAVVANSSVEMSDKLRHAAERLADPKCVRINDRSGIFFTAQPLYPSGGKVAILFPGEGSQYPGMLADLCMRFGEARHAFDRADRAFEHHPRGLLPSQLVFGAANADRLWDMDHAVEMVFSGNAAVHAVLTAFGVEADVVLGHSTGDYSALFASGALRMADDAELIELMLNLNSLYQELAGTEIVSDRALLAVGAGDATLIERVLELIPALDLAMDNCPHQRVLCGSRDLLAQARERLAAEGAVIEELAFGRGYHTASYRPALAVLQSFFDALPLQAPAVELWSCASASPVPADLDEFRTLALEQWAMPVRFTETVERLWEHGVRIFVESGPRGNLTGFVKDILRQRPHLAVACDGMHRPTVTHLLFALGQMAAHRVPLNLSPLGRRRIERPPSRGADKVARRTGPVLTLATGLSEMRISDATALKFASAPVPSSAAPPLPPTPEQAPAPTTQESVNPADLRGTLMAAHLAMSRRMVQAQERILTTFLNAGTPAGAQPKPVWPFLVDAGIRRDGGSLTAMVNLSLARHPFLSHHTLGGPVSSIDPKLTGLPVMPLTMTLELAAEAALELVPGSVCIGFENVVARRWIALTASDRTELDVTVGRHRPGASGTASVSVEIGPVGGRGPADAHFSADVRLAPSYPSAPSARVASSVTQARWDRNRVYREAMFHGPLFQGIERVTRLDDVGANAMLEVLARDKLLAAAQPRFAIDPILLDQPGQVVGVWTADRLAERFVIFPTRLARLELFSSPLAGGARVGCHADIQLIGEAGVLSDLEVDDGAGRVHARFTGWEDRRFDVPPSFQAFILDPRRASVCRPSPSDAQYPSVRVARADLPSGFAAPGAIWQQVLAGLILSAGERQTWQSATTRTDAEQWLLGRLVAKDAARRWLAQRGLAVPPADILITGDSVGQVVAIGEWAAAVGGAIEVMTSIVDGEAVASVHTRRADVAAGEAFGRGPGGFAIA